MKRPVLDRTRPFATVHNIGVGDDDPTMAGIRYQQFGRNFDREGRWLPPEGTGASEAATGPDERPLPPELVPPFNSMATESVWRPYEDPPEELL